MKKQFDVRPSTIEGEDHVDEIVTSGWDCHIEQLSDNDYILIFRQGDEEHRFYMGSKTGRAKVVIKEI